MAGRDPFFVGYLPVPAALRPFLISVAVSFVVFLGVVGAVMGLSQDDPGDGAFRFDWGRQTVTGVLVGGAYPVVRVLEGSERVPEGHTLMLAGGGKTGVQARAEGLDGRLVTVSGVILKRGDLDMMQVRGGADGFAPAEGEAPILPLAEDLGRWRLAGEICDGKCLAGAMRPGRGLAHKACADLCIDGGVPPVFVSSQPVEGSEFLLITGPEGGPLPGAARHRIGQYVSVEGRIARHGDLLVFAIDPETLEVLP